MSGAETTDVKYYLGRMCGVMESMQADIQEIKSAMIPDGQNRMGRIETKVEELAVWKKSTQVLVALFIGFAGWIEAKLNLIGGMFNG